MKHRGLAQIPLMIGLLLMAVALPVATKLVQNNQENRGQARETQPCKYCALVSGRNKCLTRYDSCSDSANECSIDANCIPQGGQPTNPPPTRICNVSYEDRGCGSHGCASDKMSQIRTNANCTYTELCSTNSSCVATPPTAVPPTAVPTSSTANGKQGDLCAFTLTSGTTLPKCSTFCIGGTFYNVLAEGTYRCGVSPTSVPPTAKPTQVLKNLCDAGDSCVAGTAFSCSGGVTYGSSGVCEYTLLGVPQNGTCCKKNAPTIAPGATCSGSGGTCLTLDLRKTKDCKALVFGKEFSDCKFGYEAYYDCCKTLVAKPTPTTKPTHPSVKPTVKPTATPAVSGSSCYCLNACYTGASCAYTSYMPAPYVKCPTNSFCTIPTVTPSKCGTGLYCTKYSVPTGSSKCISNGIVTNCCPSGQIIKNGACVKVPPCRAGLACGPEGSITGATTCASNDPNKLPVIDCCAAGQTIKDGVCVADGGVVLPYTTTVPGKCANSDPCTLPIVAEKCAEQCCGTGHYYYNSEHKKYYCGTEPGPTGANPTNPPSECGGKTPPDQCPVSGNPNQLGVNAKCITLNGQKIWDWDLKLCDQKGKTSACGIKNYCCPSVGGSWTTDMTQCPVTCTQCAGKPEAKGKGDADCSGTTDINDASIWRSEFTSGQLGTEVSNSWRADFDCDGKVTLNDISIWRENFIKGLTN